MTELRFLRQTRDAGLPRLPSVAALGLYVALFGCLCSLAALGSRAFPLLILGAVPAIVLPLVPRRQLFAVLFAAAALLVGMALWRLETHIQGVMLFFNRLYAASEAKGTYLYAHFPVTAADPAAVTRMLLPAGKRTSRRKERESASSGKRKVPIHLPASR